MIFIIKPWFHSKSMKFTFPARFTLLLATALIGLVASAVAGPHANRRSGSGFDSDNNPGVLGRSARESRGGVFNSQNNPGMIGSQFGRTTAESAGMRPTQPVAIF